MFEKNKKIFLFVGIFAVLLVLYYLFFSGSDTEPQNSALSPAVNGLVSELSVSPADAIVGRELLSMLTELQSIKLDDSIFSDPVFGSLQDWSRPIDPQPLGKSLGRRNPFSDFGGTVGSNLPPATSGSGVPR